MYVRGEESSAFDGGVGKDPPSKIFNLPPRAWHAAPVASSAPHPVPPLASAAVPRVHPEITRLFCRTRTGCDLLHPMKIHRIRIEMSRTAARPVAIATKSSILPR